MSDAREPAESNDPAAARDPAGSRESAAVGEPRPLIERLGLAAIALVLAMMFGGVAVASWFGGELFLAIMGGIGCLMTLWVGAVTLFRG
jgi:hypothetical protein